MTKLIGLTPDSARRTRDVVREVEAGRQNLGGRQRYTISDAVFVRIIAEVGDGEYEVEEVKRDNNEWVQKTNDIFTNNQITVWELNGITGIDVDTVVEVEFLRDITTNERFWGFGATGAGAKTPFQGSVHPDGDKIRIGVDRGQSPTADPDYPFRDTITIGLDTLHKEFLEDTVVITADKTFVYYKITKAGTSITATLEASTTYPVQTHGEWYVVLGMANWAAADPGPPALPARVTKWTQYWFGDIHAMAGFA